MTNFQSLISFDEAAKKQASERFFLARIQSKKYPAESLDILFQRGSGKSPLSVEQRQRIYATHTDPPNWSLTSLELDNLGRLIDDLLPDPQRVFFFVIELNADYWTLSYGKDLTLSESGSDLEALVERVYNKLNSGTSKNVNTELKHLSSLDPVKRLQSWLFIVESNDIALMKQSLHADHDDVQLNAVKELTKRHELSAFPDIMDLAKSENPRVKREAVIALGEYRSADSLPLLSNLLEDNYEISTTVAALGKTPHEEVEVLVLKALSSDSAVWRAAAIKGVLDSDYRPAIPRLIDMLSDEGEVSRASDGGPIDRVKHEAFNALGRMRAEEALPVFKKLLGSEESTDGVSEALVDFGGQEVIDLILEVLDSTDIGPVLSNSCHIIRQGLLHQKFVETEQLNKAVLELLSHKAPDVRRDACFAISATSYKAAYPRLREMLSDMAITSNKNNVKSYATFALERMASEK